MKYLILLLGVLMIGFYECISNKPQGKVYTISDLSGDWVNCNYLKAVQTSKSAKLSQSSCEYNFIRFHNDSALLVIQFHEGLDLKIVPTSENIFTSIYNNDTATFQLKNDTLFLSFQKHRDTLVSYQMSVPSALYSNRLLNKEIFAGNYQCVDSSTKTISFSTEGEVTGFLNFTKYMVLDDYFDSGCEHDIVYFNNDMQDRQNKFTWIFNKDTLRIYKLDCNAYDSINKTCNETKRGNLIYTLKKK